MTTLEEKIFQEIHEEIEKFSPQGYVYNIGYIESIEDGVAMVGGLSDCMMGEVLIFPNDIKGLVLNLKKDSVGVIILGDHTILKEKDQVRSTGKILSIKVSESVLGRVVNPLVEAIDGGELIKESSDTKVMLIEKIASGIVERDVINTPLQTGITAIDTMIPIGRGQRELIIGDRNTGKTAIAVDAIINQAKENKRKGSKKVISIYVAIGQKQAKVAQVVEKLEEQNALKDSIVVSAGSADPVSLQYIAPYAGCAIAEYFMQKGLDVLIIYDDLTKHAWAYRQISLLLRRPAGREAYPGDIFYLHSRLLERAGKMNRENGGGSITALPIIETQAQDISAYIPTNVISITDGQIYLESDLFYQGIRPAINVGLSVSRVGGAAQLKMVKQVAGQLRLEIAQYNELSAFAQFGTDLDATSKARIDRGQRILEVLKQSQFNTVSIDRQVLEIWFVVHGYLDSVDIDVCLQKSKEFAQSIAIQYPKFTENVYSKEGMTDEIEKKLTKIAKDFQSKY